MTQRTALKALRFRQWLPEWDSLRFDAREHRRKPKQQIYLLSMRAEHLRALSGVYRRERMDGVASGIQRGHEKARSKQIRDYVRYGYPFSEMSEARRNSFDSADLRKPGWLPTAIVVNVLTSNDERRGRRVDGNETIEVVDEPGCSTFLLPSSFTGSHWSPQALAPLEVIDGQHRLYAFDGDELSGEFELPVVAFVGLDIGWQAYIFWSINVSPKRINPSHAFDLYPLLRSQDWLEKFAESSVYRQARAQELTEFLFRHSASPWRNRINMLGERGKGGISQAGWIRSLTATFLSAGVGKSADGLFGAEISEQDGPLPWSRPQQAAFLIQLWKTLEASVASTNSQWAIDLRGARKSPLPDPAFAGRHTFLDQEQGLRAVNSVANEMFFRLAQHLHLDRWDDAEDRGWETDETSIDDALKSIKGAPFIEFMNELCGQLAQYDWRSPEAPNLDYETRLAKRGFRGAGGYPAFREDVLRFLAEQDWQYADVAKILVA